MLRIDQILADMQYGDAITDHALAIRKALSSFGFESNIYAENIHPSLTNKVKHISEYKEGECVIHHFAIGSDVNKLVGKLKVLKKILIYHNITPPHFFSGYNLKSELMCKGAREQLKSAADTYDIALAVSEFNRNELVELGFKNTDVLPILYDYSKAIRYPRKSKDTNILFLGRIAPNKCQQDVIKAFYYYKNLYNKDAKLYIAGAYNGMEKYLSDLIHFVKNLDLDDVYFTGRLSYEQMYKLYSNTDLFLCMSEHEGFCVPLIECMYYNIPALVYDAGAVAETMGNSGVVFNKKDYRKVAAMMNEIINNNEFKLKITESQSKRLNDFSYETVSYELKRIISNIGLE